MKKLTIILLVVALLFSLTACSVPGGQASTNPDVESDSSDESKVLRFSILSEPEAMDPQDGADTTSKIIRGGIFEGLLCWRDGKITPAAAESWEISDDGLTYTFKIRKDAKWWDEKPVTAQDFVDGTVRLVSPDGPNGSYAYYGYFLENAEAYHKGEIKDASKIGVKALDEKTLEFKLINPVPYFLSINASGFFLPVRKDYVEKYGKEFVADADKVMGNGAFVLKDWKHEQSLIFEKNSTYWDKESIELDKVEIYVIPDENTALNMYENDELDFAKIPSELVEQYEQKGEALYYENGTVRYIECNMKSKSDAGKFLANDNFRMAMQYAIDRQGFVNAVCNDGSVPALRYIPNNMAICGTTWGEKYPCERFPANTDLKKAEEYLNKALKELGVTKEQIPTIELMTNDTSKSKVAAEALQDMYSRNLGLKIDIKLVQSKQQWALRAEGQYDIMYMGMTADYNDPNAFLDGFLSYSNNRCKFADPEFDKLIEAASVEIDENKRADILWQAEQKFMDRCPLLVVFFEKTAWAKKDYVQNIVRDVISDIDPNFIYADIVK